MAYKLNSEGGLFLIRDLESAEATVPFVVGNQLDISKSGMYLRTGALDRTVYVTCESLQAEPLLGDGWEDVTEVSVRRLEYPVELPESMRGKVFSPSGALTADEAEHNWRLRISASGRQDGYDGVPRSREEYLLQTWPAPPRPPVVVRKTSTFPSFISY